MLKKEKIMQKAKWSRVAYMPGTGLYNERERVTGNDEHIALSRRAASEGMVLLKNEENFLPLKKGAKIALFGKAQADYVKGGGGSGDTVCAYVRSLASGLEIKEQEGKVEIFKPLSDYYREYVKKEYEKGIAPGFVKEPELPENLLAEAQKFCDTAVITICRFSGEEKDRTGKPFDGDFYLSKEETAMAEEVKKNFENVVVVLNVGGIVDTLWFKDEKSVKSALLAWQGGMEGGLAVSDILVGDICPSGRLADTFAVNFDAYPSSENFFESDDYVEYTEDIYVGYRYFETVPGQKEKTAYPFGYGLSYTEFCTENAKFYETDGKIVLSCDIRNIGKIAGKQVLQVYCSAPQGKLGKPSSVLVGFCKTNIIEPGKSEKVKIEIDPYYFSSYDDTGKVKKSAYVLEKGEYTVYAGFNVRDVREKYVFELTEDKILSELSEKCAPHALHKRMLSSGSYEPVKADEIYVHPAFDESVIPLEYGNPGESSKWYMPWRAWGDGGHPTLLRVYEGKITLDEFVSALDDEQKIHLLCGQPNRGIGITFGIGNLALFGVPNIMTADGPAGLRVMPDCGIHTTAFPCATLMACTWNTDLAKETASAGADEVLENGVGMWLTPAINIHRTPLCGRNFEYFSEDPFLAGKMASAVVSGIQYNGVACSLKHFACNNKETNRKDSDSILSERALREIYLKAFEICVKEAHPKTVMSSYNMINGQRASTNRELLTDILRGEWGFEGLVTSDWWTHAAQWEEINAGNDLKMANGSPEMTFDALREGKLQREALENSVRRVLKLILSIN